MRPSSGPMTRVREHLVVAVPQVRIAIYPPWKTGADLEAAPEPRGGASTP
jgi:hypothetical protein